MMLIISINNNEYNGDYTLADNDIDNAFDNIIPTTVLL
jgi:hypothetical protein